MWLAAVCSLMNSAAPISRLLMPSRDEREDLDLARRQAVGQRRGAGRAKPSVRTRREERAHPDPLGERLRLAEQRDRLAARGAAPRASSMRPYS